MGATEKLQKIRNVCLAGHGGSGKTTLSEAFLYHCKVTTRIGRVEDGTTLSDTMQEEKDRQSSMVTSVLNGVTKGVDFNILDAPGYPDFIAEAHLGIHAADTVLITMAAAEGVTVTTRRMFKLAEEAGKAVAFAFTKVDADNINFPELLKSVRDRFGDRCIPMTAPVGLGGELSGVVNVLDKGDDLPDGLPEGASSWREQIVEAAVETEDELLEKYLEGEEIAQEDLHRAIRKAIATRAMFPIFCVSVPGEAGIDEWVQAMIDYFPAPCDVPPPLTVDGEPIEVTDDGPAVGQVFKCINDDYVGKLTYIRFYSGYLGSDGSLINKRTEKPERIQNLFRVQGKDQTPVNEALAGGIYAVTKIETFDVSDTLYDKARPVDLKPLTFPTPMVSLAVEPKSRADEQRISGALTKLAAEDTGLTYQRDPDTHELVITGMSQLHLELKLKQLKRRFSVEVNTKLPKVPYRETITAKGDAKYRHKKQTGGAGQFAEVWMRIEPLVDEEGRPAGYEYGSAVVGGAISQTFIPSIEKGVKQVLVKGPLAGFPVNGVKVTVYDGKEHPVDSKDIAFQIAGREVFKLAMGQAKPKMMEPIMDLEVTVPSRYMGDLTGDLNSRRGRIMGMESEGGEQTIKAQVPLAEILSYSTELKSMTQDEGAYSITFSHYEIVPDNVAQAVIAKAQKEEEED